MAGLAAGAINSVAGGGSLITFPVLVASGLPALTANVTNTVGQCPGYATAVVGYRRELRGQVARMRTLGAVAVVGAGLGIALLELSSRSTFRAVVPWLVLFASLLLAAQPPLARRLAARAVDERRGPRPVLLASILAASAYGAYFGAGLGVMLLAVLAILVSDRLQRLNALNRWLSLVINVVALVAFAFLMPVDWPVAGVLALATLLGAQGGVLVARRLSDRTLRAVVVTCGIAATAYLAATT